ncbi:hypothetical protein Tsubulata_029325 [Turnera subulata]|uniref:Uncharacterized protein n=1 Tax=Turnera subulata TaxID=218843 RepID=A0A9Q0JGG2_9ROSI|nr:hypothetical protein Tsubulata_029325 [Turnera subulata]
MEGSCTIPLVGDGLYNSIFDGTTALLGNGIFKVFASPSLLTHHISNLCFIVRFVAFECSIRVSIYDQFNRCPIVIYAITTPVENHIKIILPHDTTPTKKHNISKLLDHQARKNNPQFHTQPSSKKKSSTIPYTTMKLPKVIHNSIHNHQPQKSYTSPYTTIKHNDRNA